MSDEIKKISTENNSNDTGFDFKEKKSKRNKMGILVLLLGVGFLTFSLLSPILGFAVFNSGKNMVNSTISVSDIQATKEKIVEYTTEEVEEAVEEAVIAIEESIPEYVFEKATTNTKSIHKGSNHNQGLSNSVQSFAVSDINNIFVNTIFADIDVRYTNNDDISVEWKSKNFSEAINVYVDDGTLVITDEEFSNSFMNFKGGDIDITISIPKNRVFYTVDISTVSGDLEWNGVDFTEGKFNTVSGDLEFENVTFHNTIFNSTSGDIELENVIFRHMNINTVSGDASVDTKLSNFDIAYNTILKSNTSQHTVQNGINNGFDDNKIEFNTVSGKLEINNLKYT